MPPRWLLFAFTSSHFQNWFKALWNMDSFDPYQDWLGIVSQLRPVDHYLLLGLQMYESDARVITLAYETRMKLLKQFQSGPRGQFSQQLITEVGKAKRDLLDPSRKAKYDLDLKQQLQLRRLELNQSQVLPAQQIEGHVSFPMSATLAATTSPEQAELASGNYDDEDEGLSAFWFLKDVRYAVGLLVLSVVIMTATVKLFSPSQDQTTQAFPASPVSAEVQSDSIAPSLETLGEVIASPSTVKQAGDGTFELPLELGELTGDLKYASQGISNWRSGDQAAWTLDVVDPRKGYFKCKILYCSKIECSFEVRSGDRKPRQLTLYPHQDDFEEEFIVRLARVQKTTSEQTFRLTAKASAGGVEIKRIMLVPND